MKKIAIGITALIIIAAVILSVAVFFLGNQFGLLSFGLDDSICYGNCLENDVFEPEYYKAIETSSCTCGGAGDFTPEVDRNRIFLKSTRKTEACCSGRETVSKNQILDTQKSFDYEDIKQFKVYYEVTGDDGDVCIQYGDFGYCTPKGKSKGTLSFKTEHSFLDITKYTAIINGIEQGEYTIKEEGENKIRVFLSGNAQAYVHPPRYRIPYGCEVKEDEVPVFDVFDEGSIVNVESLKYVPVKFCLDNPPIDRSMADEGIKQDTKGELFQIIAMGKSAIVPNGHTYRIPYITKFVEGQTLRCGVGEAYNTRTEDCTQIAEESNIILGCYEDSDCPIPDACKEEKQKITCEKNECIGYETIECKNEVIVVQEIIKEVEEPKLEPVYLAENQFTFSSTKEKNSFNIGGLEFTDAFPSNAVIEDMVESDSFQASFTFDGKQYLLQNNAESTLNKYIKVKYTKSGGKTENTYVNSYLFTIDNDFLDVDVSDSDYYHRIDDKKPIKFEIINDLTGFTNAGLNLRYTFDLTNTEDFKTSETKITKGRDTYYITPDTSNLGKAKVEITPYAKIIADQEFTVLAKNKLTYSYYVLNEDEEIPKGTISYKDFNYWPYVIGAIAILFILSIIGIVGLILIAKKN